MLTVGGQPVAPNQTGVIRSGPAGTLTLAAPAGDGTPALFLLGAGVPHQAGYSKLIGFGNRTRKSSWVGIPLRLPSEEVPISRLGPDRILDRLPEMQADSLATPSNQLGRMANGFRPWSAASSTRDGHH